ncbi:MAG: sigma factor-like helix-turn-helix DNA-binding protein [Patulibacter sp.]
MKPSEIDELIAAYRAGASMVELGRKHGIHHQTVRAHLRRRGEPVRTRGLEAKYLDEAIRLYEDDGLTLLEIGQRLGASQSAVRRALARKGVTIRPQGRRPVAA